MSELLLESRGVVKSYRSDGFHLQVLRGVDLAVAKGEMVAVMGASGAGKSTLLHVLGILDAPDEGTLCFEGRNVFQLSERERTRLRSESVGFIFQFHHLLPEFTALENVMMPLLISRRPRPEASRRASELLAELGLAERGEHRPARLSGGEQQRVAVARALAASPRLVLADEPTGNLDSASSDELIALFHQLHRQQDLTSVIVTHNEKIAASCDRVLEMTDGRLKEA